MAASDAAAARSGRLHGDVPRRGDRRNHATREVTLRTLELQPADLVMLIRDDNQQAMTELDDRIVRYAVTNFDPRPDVPIAIRYMERQAAPFSVFELMPLVRNVRRLIDPIAAAEGNRPGPDERGDVGSGQRAVCRQSPARCRAKRHAEPARRSRGVSKPRSRGRSPISRIAALKFSPMSTTTSVI